MRILITGSTGLLGQALHGRLTSGHDVWGVSRRVAAPRQLMCNVTDVSAVFAAVERVRPEVIVHTAAQSNVDRCETEPQTAQLANVEATRHLVTAAQRCGAMFIYVSTDYVFDGLKGSAYTEADLPHPANYYGRTKLEGEAVVQQSGLPWMILRVSTLFGPGRTTFVDRVIQCAEAGQPVPVFVDQTTSPTYTLDVAEGVARLLDSRATGVVHVVNAGAARRDVVARAVLATWGIPAMLEARRLTDCPLPARRPPNSSLAMTRIQSLTGWSPQPWETALQQHLAWKKRSKLCNSAL